MKDERFKADAKQIVDLCFDTKFFDDKITRDHMNEFENLIVYLLQSRFESYKRSSALTEEFSKLSDK